MSDSRASEVGLWPEDARLAALYDIECAGRDDHDFYLGVAADLQASRVVDIGCGTGVFAVDLAQRGHEALGVDPAAAILDVARRRPGGDAVTWLLGDASDVDSDSADLVVMMGHVAQYFVDDAEWQQTLDDIFGVLASGGHLTFETRNPLIDWLGQWTRDTTTAKYAHPDGGEFTSWVEVIGRTGTASSYQMTHQGHTVLPGGEHVWANETLRFRSPSEIIGTVEAAGFAIEKVWGDWGGSPWHDGATEHIVLAAKT